MNNEELKKLKKQYEKEISTRKKILELQEEIPVSEFEEKVDEMEEYRIWYDPFSKKSKKFEEIFTQIIELKKDERVQEYIKLVNSLDSYDRVDGVELDKNGNLDKELILDKIIENFTIKNDEGIYVYLGSFTPGEWFQSYDPTCMYRSDFETHRLYQNIETKEKVRVGVVKSQYYDEKITADEFEKEHFVFALSDVKKGKIIDWVKHKNFYNRVQYDYIDYSIKENNEASVNKLLKKYTTL